MININIEEKQKNMDLCRRFPFLIPSNRFSGMRITDAANGGYYPHNPDEVPEYDYEYTELDVMPAGWRKAFGEQMCQEIMDELVANNMVDAYRILQIKEKFGSLCWYDNGFTKRGHEIIDKYERLSYRTCIKCGAPATRITRGWITPVCDACCGNIDASDPIDDEEMGQN